MPGDAAPPSFRYHPNPLETGSAIRDDANCDLCGQARGVIYDGPIYGRQPEALCLVCISSGDAARRLGVGDDLAEFTDVGFGVPDGISASVLDELAHRTPGFRGWQQEHWLYLRGDAAAFIGRAGYAELMSHPDAQEMLLHENEEFGWTPDQSRDYVRNLHSDGDATAYIFRCLACGAHVAYSDMS